MKTVLPQNSILSRANTVTVDAEKLAKLRTAGIHINADWNANDGPAQILHKPTKVTAFENDAGYVTGSDIDGKADKRPPAEDGNFAALDESGNLIDSGKKAANFATVSHVHTFSQIPGLQPTFDSKVDKDGNKKLSTNDYTDGDKNKLAGIESGAEPNQNAFSAVKVGTTVIQAGGKTDTIEIIAGDNVSITADDDSKRIKINAAGGGGGGGAIVQADWAEDDPLDSAFIKNKPDLSGYVEKSELNTEINALENGKVDKQDGKGLSTNDFTNDYRNKLVGIEAGAQQNQNAFSKIKSGDADISAAGETDQIELAAGDNIDISVDQNNKKITISSRGGSASQIQTDWAQIDETKPDFIKNKPESFPPETHEHEQSEINGLIEALNEKVTARQLGSAAYKNIPETGADANVEQVVMGDDSRLSDAREPILHSHDEISKIIESDYTSLRISENGTLVFDGLNPNGSLPRWASLELTPVYKTMVVDVVSRLANVQFSAGEKDQSDEYIWNNKLLILVWGNIGVLAGRMRTINGEFLNMETEYNLGTISIPPGFVIPIPMTGASFGIFYSVNPDGSVRCYPLRTFAESEVVHIALLFPIERLIPSDYDTVFEFSDGSRQTVSGSVLTRNLLTEAGIYGGSSWIKKPVKVWIGKTVTEVGDFAFTNCVTLEQLIIPDGQLLAIGTSAFYNCSNLKTLSLPSSVAQISTNAFVRCSSLTSISVDEKNQIYDSRENCNALIRTSNNTLLLGCASTVIPDSVTSIGDRAFENCHHFTSMPIPNSVTSIGDYAFHSCANLRSITIPDSVTSIGENAFSHCANLKSATIGNGVTSIGNYSFSHCTDLTSVTIGDSVTNIGIYAFRDCSGLTSVTISDSVTSVGDYAFAYCTGLMEIIIGRGISNIGENAFLGCSNVSEFTMLNETRDDLAISENAFGNIGESASPMGSSVSGTKIFHVPPLTDELYPMKLTDLPESKRWLFNLCDSTRCNFELWRDAPTERHIPAWDECTKSTNWNDTNAEIRYMNNLSPYITFDDPNDQKISFVDRTQFALDSGCNYVAYFVSNYDDDSHVTTGRSKYECHNGATPETSTKIGYSPYGSNAGFWNMILDDEVVPTMSRRLKYANDNGLGIVLFLIADDSGNWFNKLNHEAEWTAYCRDLKKTGWLDIASIVVVGLEIEEYDPNRTVNWQKIVRILRDYYFGKVAVHHEGARSAATVKKLAEDYTDITFVQLPPVPSESLISAYIQNTKMELNKPVCLFELDRHPNQSLSEYALANGAYSIGNWGAWPNQSTE